jgi:peptidoglycan/xylan/chitin deacetylase (PgdA/CDA1 family)
LSRSRQSVRPLILAYHAVSEGWRSPLAVSLAVFREQMEFLHRSGYAALPFRQCEERRQAGTLPAKPVVITFDDAFQSILSTVPILANFGWQASVFVVSQFADTGRRLDWYGLNPDVDDAPPPETCGLRWEELRELAALGWEIGSHTHRHTLLTNLSDGAVLAELEVSRRRISEETGSCASVSYPYGRANLRVARLAEEVGFKAGCMLTGAHLFDEPLLRPRLSVCNRDTGVRLSLKVSGLGLATRRSSAARAVHRLRRQRRWMPAERKR